MNVLGAFAATLRAIDPAGEVLGHDPDDPCSLTHLGVMLQRMDAMVDEGTGSVGKLNRWLGYLQGVVVARGLLTLDQVKAINQAHSEDS